MTQLLNLISSSEKQNILDKLEALQQVCCPTAPTIKPTFTFKNSQDFVPGLDDFTCGISGNGYQIKPHQLKNYFYENKRELRDSHVDFIKAGGLKWYYNTSEIIGAFFSEDGKKKVEVDFNFWMDAEQLWSVPGLKKAIQCVLEKCTQNTFPTQAEAEQFFSDDLCRRLYKRAPLNSSIKQAVMEIIEPLRKTLLTTLVNTKTPAIAQTVGFKKYAKSNSLNMSKPIQNLVQEYLKKNKNALYLLGEKFQLIKHANRMIHYQDVRDAVRHPQEVKAALAKPEKVYQDFCEILGQNHTPSQQDCFQMLTQNTETFDNLQYMSEILTILNIYANKTISKKKPAYWQDLVQQGILDSTEVPYLQKMILKCNSVAHVDDMSGINKGSVANEGKLMQISMDLAKRHSIKQYQKHQQLGP